MTQSKETEWEEQDHPRTSEWEDYFAGHGVEIRRRYVELPNDAWFVYRAECEDAALAVEAQDVETVLTRMIRALVDEEYPARMEESNVE